jgi:hypothetical protein
MKKACLLLFFFATLTCYAQPFTYNWVVQMKGALPANYNSINSVATDGEGNVTVTGEFFDTLFIQSTFLTSKGKSDRFLIKFDSSGRVVWMKSGGSLQNARGVDVVCDKDGYTYALTVSWGPYVIGNDTLRTDNGGNDFLIIEKLDKDGNLVWYTKAGGRSTFPEAMTLDHENNVVVCGESTAYSIFEKDTVRPINAYGMFVAKYTENGKYLWSKSTVLNLRPSMTRSRKRYTAATPTGMMISCGAPNSPMSSARQTTVQLP